MNKVEKHRGLLQSIRSIILEARKYVSRRVNYAQIVSNWFVGQMIVEEEQKGQDKAEYGKQLIEYLSKELQSEFGNGYSESNLQYFRRFYIVYRIPHAVSGKLQRDKSEISHAVSTELEHGYKGIRHLPDDEFNLVSLNSMIEDSSHPPLCENLENKIYMFVS
ncbi:MAG: DUF1016 domain-containing protein [Chlorobi bacterium]|nr:DUF1016 domain-containing protein [Chlorobiota bacterium]